MRTPDEQRPAPYLNRRDQYRMLAMVGMLCLIVAAYKVAAKPESWHWLIPPTPPSADGTSVSDAGEQPPLKELDFGVRTNADDPLPPGAFRSERVATKAVAANDADSNVRDAALDPSIDTSHPTQLPEGLFDAVKDNTLGIRRSEGDAYGHLLVKAAHFTEQQLEQAARNDVAFTVLMLESDDYRGDLITISGALRRLTPFPVGESTPGIDQLFEGWVFTLDSGTHPYRIVCTEVPAGLTVGERIEPQPVQVTGYFLKRQGYAAAGGQHVAPLLLAKTIRWTPPRTASTEAIGTGLARTVLVFVTVIGVCLALALWRFSIGDKQFETARLQTLRDKQAVLDRETLAGLEQIETIDPQMMFEDLD